MRIALLTTSYPDKRGDAAGHFVETEATQLAAQGHCVEVIAPGARSDCQQRGSITIWRAGGSSLFGSPGALNRATENPLRLLQLFSFGPGVRRLLSALAPFDRAIAHFVVPCGYPLALGLGCELEVVLHGSDVRLVLALPSAVRHHIARRLLAANARFRFSAEDLRSSFLRSLAPGERDQVRGASRVELPALALPSSLECARSRPAGALPRWVYCGRLIASKRVDLAIREAARHGAHLTVIGDGPLRTHLEKLAASFETPVQFVGQLSRDEALGRIARANRLVHLSEAEGAPTVVREARALGVPVLATPVGDVHRWAAVDPGIEIFRPA
ncbi:MAG TPA: glycosyltransferase family 4 protein [Polyangiaceae bacterium]